MGGEEFIVIIVIAVIVIGPERLPQYVQKVTEFVRGARRFMADTKSKVEEDLGPEFSDIDWQKLDPRQYDPRRIVREALLEDTVFDQNSAAKKTAQAAGLAGAAGLNAAQNDSVSGSSKKLGFDTYVPLSSGQTAPFDTEAT